MESESFFAAIEVPDFVHRDDTSQKHCARVFTYDELTVCQVRNEAIVVAVRLRVQYRPRLRRGARLVSSP